MESVLNINLKFNLATSFVRVNADVKALKYVCIYIYIYIKVYIDWYKY